jgi:hypothetical protein
VAGVRAVAGVKAVAVVKAATVAVVKAAAQWLGLRLGL